MNGSVYEHRSKLMVLLGEQFLSELRGLSVIDFGCGEGEEAIEMARAGASRVFGLDIRPEVLQRAANRAQEAGVADRCRFGTACTERADVVVSIDSFEHFADPAGVLHQMFDLLAPGGRVYASFGPTWYHPLGGHLFSVFPWAHLVFSEAALLRWRSDIRSDGATRFSEVAGGLNQMSIRRFEQIVQRSRFRLDLLEAVPIRKLRPLHSRLTREWTTAIVRAKLSKPA